MGLAAVKPGDLAVTFSWRPPDDLDAFKAIPRGYPEGLFLAVGQRLHRFPRRVCEGWLDRELGTSLYDLKHPAEVGELADALDGWLEGARAAGTETTDIGDGTQVPLVAIEVLAQFVRLTATRRLWLFPDY